MRKRSLAALLLLFLVSVVAAQPTKSAPRSAAGYLSRGNARWRKGNLDGAISDFTKAIELDPNSADAYYSRCAVRQTQNDVEDAIADYSKAIELNPTLADAYLNRGILL